MDEAAPPKALKALADELQQRNLGISWRDNIRYVQFIDPTGVDHRSLGVALNKALYNYMYGIGLEENVGS